MDHYSGHVERKLGYKLLKKSFAFRLTIVPAGIGYVINEMLDRIFLKRMNPESIEAIYGTNADGSIYSGEDIVGIYSAAYKLAVVMLLFVTVYRYAWQPFFYEKI